MSGRPSDRIVSSAFFWRRRATPKAARLPTTVEIAPTEPVTMALFLRAAQKSGLEKSVSYQVNVRPSIGKLARSFRPNENSTTRTRGESMNTAVISPKPVQIVFESVLIVGGVPSPD